MKWLTIVVCLGALQGWRTAEAAPPPCDELAQAADLKDMPPDDRRVFCDYAKGTVAGGCCQGTLYECLKNKPTCARGRVLADIGKGTIATGATADKATAAAAAYEDGFAENKRDVIDTSKVPCRGARDGVVLAEFSDFDCPHCAAAAPRLEKLVADLNGQNKHVRLCSFTFPLPGHPNSQLASAAALYADTQGKFWPMYDALFATQDEREGLDEAGYRAQLLKIGKRLGLDPTGLTAALQPKSSFVDKAKDQLMLGVSLLLQGTPTFFIDGRKLDGVPVADIEAAVTDELESKGKK